MRTLTLLFGLLAALAASAQHTPFRRDEGREKALLAAIGQRYQRDLSGLGGPNKKDLARIYQQRYDAIGTLFREGSVLTDAAADAYLNRLLGEILKVHPDIRSAELRVLFSNAWWPNAASMGEGTIFVNAGLFHRLRNESQAAFVICHELAHYLLQHGNRSIDRYVAVMNSDSMQKKLKSIQRTEFRQNQQLETLARSLAFGSHRHSREFELEADSMALALMQPTAFDAAEALTCLALLDSIDSDKFKTPLALEQRFSFASQPFKKTWLESDALSFAAGAEADSDADADSLKTHPDCRRRIARLQEIGGAATRPGTRKSPVAPEAFDSLVHRFDYGVIQSSFDSKQVSRSLYLTLRMLGSRPDDLWLQVMVSRCLNEIHLRQKRHELGRYVDLPGPEYNAEYNGLLHLIQNIRLHEIAVISYHFLLPRRAQVEEDPAYFPVWKQCIENY